MDKSLLNKIINATVVTIGILFGMVVLAVVLRIFVCDTFPVNSHSMSPTIVAGDRIVVNKLLFGARIYKNLDFLDGAPMESFRMKGLRGIRYNDIVVFNHPSGRKWYKTEFAINSVYVKRCIGMPGDTISIRSGIYRNSSVRDTVGFYKAQKAYAPIIDSAVLRAYPAKPELGWTIKEFGPLYLPRKGDTVKLTRTNFLLYKRFIEYETREEIVMKEGVVLHGGHPVSEYRFRTSYYFMAGDNVSDSRDSRYFGPVPEEFIVGVAPRILSSHDPYSGKLRPHRILKRI